MRKEKIIIKIQKLLGLAGNNPNENERNAATAAAYEMLAKHNLQMSDVIGVLPEMGPNARLVLQSIIEDWARLVWCDVAKLCFCDVAWQDAPNKRNMPIVIGSFENFEATRAISNWNVKSIRVESRRTYKRDEAKQTAFATGAALALGDTIRKLLEAEKADAKRAAMQSYLTGKKEPGTSLVKVREDLQAINKKIMDEFNPQKEKAEALEPMDEEAGILGYMFGKTLTVNRMTPEDRRIANR